MTKCIESIYIYISTNEDAHILDEEANSCVEYWNGWFTRWLIIIYGDANIIAHNPLYSAVLVCCKMNCYVSKYHWNGTYLKLLQSFWMHTSNNPLSTGTKTLNDEKLFKFVSRTAEISALCILFRMNEKDCRQHWSSTSASFSSRILDRIKSTYHDNRVTENNRQKWNGNIDDFHNKYYQIQYSQHDIQFYGNV